VTEHPNNPKTFRPSYGNHTSLVDSGEKKGNEVWAGAGLCSPRARSTEGCESGSAQSPAGQNHAEPAVPSGDSHEPSEQKVEPEVWFGLLEVHLTDIHKFCVF